MKNKLTNCSTNYLTIIGKMGSTGTGGVDNVGAVSILHKPALSENMRYGNRTYELLSTS
jgi:hypothetical protein